MERFYSIEHLTTTELRELFWSYRDRGWVDFDYYSLQPDGVTRPQLPDQEIARNIHAANEHNYFVYMIDHEDEQDGVMIGFGLTEYPTFAAYLHLEKGLLDEIVEKYNLRIARTGEMPFVTNEDKSVN